MTRILFDARSLDAAPSGAKTRLLRLVPELVARGHEVSVLVSDRFDADVPDGLRGARIARAFSGFGPFRRALLPSAHARPLVALHPEVVVFETWPAPRVALPSIAVVHDLRHVREGGFRRALAARWLAGAARSVRRFHVVSEAVREELRRVVPEAASRIDVVPNAVVVPGEERPAPLPPGIAGPFVVAVGHAERRKEWPLVAAVAAALQSAGIAVVRAGRGAERPPGVTDLGVVPDGVRDALFRRAVAVLAPSSLEGFGLVPVEALACGGWVVASGIPAHEEVLGGAADTFPPGDAARATELVLAAAKASPAERAARAARARTRAGEWTPARAADAFERSLRDALA